MGKEQEHPPAEDGGAAVISFQEAAARRERAQVNHLRPSDDLKKFQRSVESDDYRHRMTMNAVGLVVVTMLILAGIWLADSFATMRQNQECVLMGRRGCAPVDSPSSRW